MCRRKGCSFQRSFSLSGVANAGGPALSRDPAKGLQGLRARDLNANGGGVQEASKPVKHSRKSGDAGKKGTKKSTTMRALRKGSKAALRAIF